MKRSDAETKAAALQARLAEAQRQLREEKMSKARLSDQLAEEHQKNLQQEKQIVDAQQQARHSEARRLDTEAAKAKNVEEALKLRLKLSETEKQRQAANSTAVKLQKLQAETLKRLESKTLESKAAAEGLTKFKQDAFQGISKLKAAAKTELAKADLKQAVTEMRLENAQRSALGQAEKVKTARKERELADKNYMEAKNRMQKAKQEAEVRMQKAELRTFRLSVRGAVRGGTGVVDKHGQVPDWKIR